MIPVDSSFEEYSLVSTVPRSAATSAISVNDPTPRNDDFTIVSTAPKTDGSKRRRRLRITRKRAASANNEPSRGLFKRLAQASRQELTLLGGLIVTLYLLNGEQSQFVCNLCSGIPAAFLSYRLISRKDAKKHAMRSILGFWILFAILLPVDHLVGHAFGYFAGKFLLMIAAFGHVCNKCERVTSVSPTPKPKRSVVVEAYTPIPTEDRSNPIVEELIPVNSRRNKTKPRSISIGTQVEQVTDKQLSKPERRAKENVEPSRKASRAKAVSKPARPALKSKTVVPQKPVEDLETDYCEECIRSLTETAMRSAGDHILSETFSSLPDTGF